MTAYRITIDVNCPDSFSAASPKRQEAYGRALEIAVREHAEKWLDNHKPPARGTTTKISAKHGESLKYESYVLRGHEKILADRQAWLKKVLAPVRES